MSRFTGTIASRRAEILMEDGTKGWIEYLTNKNPKNLWWTNVDPSSSKVKIPEGWFGPANEVDPISVGTTPEGVINMEEIRVLEDGKKEKHFFDPQPNRAHGHWTYRTTEVWSKKTRKWEPGVLGYIGTAGDQGVLDQKTGDSGNTEGSTTFTGSSSDAHLTDDVRRSWAAK